MMSGSVPFININYENSFHIVFYSLQNISLDQLHFHAESSSDNIQLDFLFPNVCLKEADIDVPVVYLKWTNAEYLRTRLSKDPDLVVSISSRGECNIVFISSYL